MSDEKLQIKEKLTPGQEIYTEISANYPFFDVQEETCFHERVAKINTTNFVEQARQLVEALNNPHTDFYKKEETGDRRIRPATSEIKGGVEIIHIPYQNPNDTPLTELFDRYSQESQGLILDLREGGGGSDAVGRKLLDKLAAKGTYKYGTNYEVKPGGGLREYPCTFNFENEDPYTKPIVILTSNKTFSSGERFIAALKAATNAVVIGTETRGGSANPKKIEKEINGDTYVIKIPTWRFVLPGESRPIEETKIKPDVFYDGPNIEDFAIKYIKNSEKYFKTEKNVELAKEEGKLTKVTENVVKALNEIDPEKKLSDLDFIRASTAYIHSLYPTQEMRNKLPNIFGSGKYHKRSKSADQILDKENSLPENSEKRIMMGCIDFVHVARAIYLARGIPSVYVETIQKEWVEKYKAKQEIDQNNGLLNPISGHIFLDVFIKEENKWYTINPLSKRQPIREFGDYIFFDKPYEVVKKGKDSSDIGFKTMLDFHKYISRRYAI